MPRWMSTAGKSITRRICASGCLPRPPNSRQNINHVLSMLSYIAAVIAGLALLIWSADKFVEGAAALAGLLGVSVMIIGITIVGFGTSSPEIVVSIVAVMENTPDIAIGNALGSNIANIGLILGVTAILVPIPVATHLFKNEYPLLILATAIM